MEDRGDRYDNTDYLRSIDRDTRAGSKESHSMIIANDNKVL